VGSEWLSAVLQRSPATLAWNKDKDLITPWLRTSHGDRRGGKEKQWELFSFHVLCNIKFI
jgi:hypothetical protein